MIRTIIQSMNQRTFIKFLLTITFFFSFLYSFSQTTMNGVKMTIEKRERSSTTQGLIVTLVKIKNDTDKNLDGFLHIDAPSSLRIIGDNVIRIQNIHPADSLFIPVKFISKNEAEASASTLNFKLINNENDLLAEQNTSFSIEERISVLLVIPDNNILITNSNDSVSVKAIVRNKGNSNQVITVVFSIPDLTGQVNFIENTYTVAPMSEHIFRYAFMPTKTLLDKGRFVINIVGMRGVAKEIFGNGSVTLQNVSSSRKFEDLSNSFGTYTNNQRNSITAAYRQYSSNTNILQLYGRNSFDLPAGYIAVQGNLYSGLGDQQQVFATNTSMTYYLNRNEFTIGNISESLDLSLFGRGAKMTLSNENQSKRIQVGVVDGSFNLFSSSPLFKDVSSIYVNGQLGAVNSKRQFYASYTYQDNIYEQAQYNVVGSEMRWTINNSWYTRVRLSAATSNYAKQNDFKKSGAIDFQYNGHLKKLDINGNYYYSSNYFPGSRRGVLSIQQSITQDLGRKFMIRSNFTYSDFSPKYLFNTINSQYKNINGEIELRLPSINMVTTSIAYQNQYEKSNAYYLYFEPIDPETSIEMKAQRLVERITWMSKDLKHTLISVTENGFVKYPTTDKYSFQMKTSATYSYKWLNLNASYQHGGYYISEYALNLNKEKSFNRMFFSGSVYKTLNENKYEISGGATYSKDPLIGESPSIFANIKYNPTQMYSIFLNSSLYQYNINGLSKQNFYNIEAGITINFPENNVSSKRKSKVTAFVYYDKNANNVYDDGDESAGNFDIIINNQAFLSNDNGNFTYTNVPFGTYDIKPVSKRGWFYKGQLLFVNKYKTKIEIPLQQSGTISGKIIYKYDKQTTDRMNLRYNNIRFRILNIDNETVQRPITNEDGKFTIFLPSGDYTIILDQNSLESNTFCEQTQKKFTVKSATIIELPAFEILVKQRRVNLKRFSDSSDDD